MINIDKKNGIFEYDDDIDVVWDEISDLLISVISLSEYYEDKDYVINHIEKIRKEYKKLRKELIEDLINQSAQNEKDEKLPDFNEDEINDLLHF